MILSNLFAASLIYFAGAAGVQGDDSLGQKKKSTRRGPRNSKKRDNHEVLDVEEGAAGEEDPGQDPSGAAGKQDLDEDMKILVELPNLVEGCHSVRFREIDSADMCKKSANQLADAKWIEDITAYVSIAKQLNREGGSPDYPGGCIKMGGGTNTGKSKAYAIYYNNREPTELISKFDEMNEHNYVRICDVPKDLTYYKLRLGPNDKQPGKYEIKHFAFTIKGGVLTKKHCGRKVDATGKYYYEEGHFKSTDLHNDVSKYLKNTPTRQFVDMVEMYASCMPKRSLRSAEGYIELAFETARKYKEGMGVEFTEICFESPEEMKNGKFIECPTK